MSLRWVESTAPFLDEECLVDALESLGASWLRRDEGIVVSAQGWRGDVTFVPRHGAWLMRRMDDAAHRQWEGAVVTAYEQAQTRKLARLEERRRREEEQRIQRERAALVEERRRAIVEKARKNGYSVKEQREGDRIRLVLVRRTY